jgi:hypothetical protein
MRPRPCGLRQPIDALLVACTVAVTVATLQVAPATAALYKWTDANGRVVYSDQPPSGNVKAEVLGNAPPPSNPNAVKDLANQDAEMKKRQLERADDAKKADKARTDAARNQDFCVQARSQMAALQQSMVVLYRLNEKGERVVLDDAERQERIGQLDRMMRERNCPP